MSSLTCKSTVRIISCFLKARSSLNIWPRNLSLVSKKLEYTEYGDPVKVIHIQEEPVREPNDNEIIIQMLAAPVNPADINTIQGKYPVRINFPSVPGNEGVGVVVQIGKQVSTLSRGDRVVPLTSGLGTWRSHAIYNETDLLKVPSELGIVEAATLTVNPCSAFRMLKDYVTLNPNDTIIQNGANSAVGQCVSQLCKLWGINNVAIVRNRPDISALKDSLLAIGATHVLTEEEIRSTDLFKKNVIPKPTLAFNCIGGKSALELLRHIDHGGIMVTYGGMSREPVTIPTSALIFKNITLKGFWMTRWSKDHTGCIEREQMFKELIDYMIQGKLGSPAHKMIPFSNYSEALMNTMTVQGFTGKKFLLDFQDLNPKI